MAPNFRNRPSLADCGAETGRVGSEPTAPKNPHLSIGNSHQVSRAYYEHSKSGSEKSLEGEATTIKEMTNIVFTSISDT